MHDRDAWKGVWTCAVQRAHKIPLWSLVLCNRRSDLNDKEMCVAGFKTQIFFILVTKRSQQKFNSKI